MGSIIPVAAITEETLAMAKAAFGAGPTGAHPIMKSGINIAEGLIGINLEAPSKKLFPVYSPLRNKIARIKAPVGASAVQWKQIDKINSANLWPGVAENARNSFNTTLTSSQSASFVTLGHDDYVGFEALARSKGFEDVRATAALNLLYGCMVSEEKVILGGNVALVAPPAAPVGVLTAGGALAADDYRIKVSSLVLRGYDKGSTGNSGADADGESTGSAQSNQITAAAGNLSVDYTWAAVKGAVAYNVYAQKAASTFTYQSTVTVGHVLLAAYAAAVPVPNTGDLTASATEHDGFISYIEKAATPAALFKDMANAKLSSDGAGGIVEIDAILKSMWDNYRLGPNEILVNSQQAADITALIGGSANLAYRIMLQDGQRNVVGGIYVGSYLNKFASSFAEGIPNEVLIKIHPNMPPSTMLFPVYTLPYPNNQVPNVWEIETLQDYTQYEWALSTRRYEFGIYWMQVLKSYFPKAQAAIVSIKPGV